MFPAVVFDLPSLLLLIVVGFQLLLVDVVVHFPSFSRTYSLYSVGFIVVHLSRGFLLLHCCVCCLLPTSRCSCCLSVVLASADVEVLLSWFYLAIICLIVGFLVYSVPCVVVVVGRGVIVVVVLVSGEDPCPNLE